MEFGRRIDLFHAAGRQAVWKTGQVFFLCSERLSIPICQSSFGIDGRFMTVTADSDDH